MPGATHTYIVLRTPYAPPVAVPRFDPRLLQQQVAASRAVGPDLVAVLIHWGPNWRWQPDKHLRKLGRAFLDAGADIVFGTSPHHIQVCRSVPLNGLVT